MEGEPVRLCSGDCQRTLLLNSDNFKETKTGFTKTCLECMDKRNSRPLSWHLMTCEHNKQRQFCKDCGGGKVCIHKKIKQNCKQCGGSSICEHNRQRHQCKECNGSSLCEHNRQRHQCKECNGSSLCVHKRIKSVCKECGGSGICEHGRIRSICKECGGSQICEHNKNKHRCRDCGGSQICEHNKERRWCKECGGSGICEHNKEKSTCKECGDPIEVTLKTFVKNWKKRDKQNNVYDEGSFIDFDYLKTLLEQQNSCCSQCSSPLKFENKSTARLFLVNNDLGHVKGNCVFKCESCIQSCKKRKRE